MRELTAADIAQAKELSLDLDFAGTATDWAWHAATGMCGGCGAADCHDGGCTYLEDHCRLCPTRKATGEVRGSH